MPTAMSRHNPDRMFLARLASDLVNVLCTFDGADEQEALAGLRAHYCR